MARDGAQAPDPARLNLLAQDADDLRVVSAACQDAVLKVSDLRWEGGRKRFTLSLNRFRWEAGGRGRGERVRSALQFGSVLSAQARGLRRGAGDSVLSLIDVAFEPGAAPSGAVMLRFAGGGDLRLQVECVDAVLTDLSRPWPARARPRHGDPK